ncbi:MAG: 4-hydroxy-3-methylbut-2-enyl diphosphate reductase [Bacteroidales bacterium]|nr:4-hydroxy-3-methylbut-2-enyl diphosphate reductase [Bacteroidales bacterium]
MTVEIDSQSGFCAGVIRAIGKAESFLEESGRHLYSLGAIVHNEAELTRLHKKGLVTLDRNDIYDIPSDARGEALLIRAHGQPPKVYERIRELGFDIIDCTCPVVLSIQKSIRESYAKLKSLDSPGQILIFGKIGHAEVLGLVGQVDGDAIVVENLIQLKELISAGTVNVGSQIEIFSQTTMSPVEYEELCGYLKSVASDPLMVTVHRTICSQVASRHEILTDFAKMHDIIIFVSGKTSSNGKVLCDLCKSVNIRTYHIGNPDELQKIWFRRDDRVGVCGATSTPKWLLEETASRIENLQ